jgi:hypothetical protein
MCHFKFIDKMYLFQLPSQQLIQKNATLDCSTYRYLIYLQILISVFKTVYQTADIRAVIFSCESIRDEITSPMTIIIGVG